jgi:flagellar basal-body rod modification protein FlgD
VSSVVDSTGSSANALEALGLTQKPAQSEESKKELGQADFLTLLTAQMKSQDPTNPMDSQQFLAQMAQFSTVQGIQDLQKSFETLATSLTANQTLQASQLVGHSVLVPGSTGTLVSEEGMTGAIDLPEVVPDLSVKIYGSAGQLVRTIPMEGQGPGLVDFKWDGLDDNGQAAAAGQYQFAAEGSLDGEAHSFDTFSLAKVNSVSVKSDTGGVVLNTQDFGDFDLNQIRQIR